MSYNHFHCKPLDALKLLRNPLILHREGEPGLLKATIHVRPGTHHVRFIQDGIMKCSALLPTTVDFGNNLVNYIEVSADDLPHDDGSVNIPSEPIGGSENKAEINQPEPVPAEERTKPKPVSRMKPAISQSQFTSEIPQYLIDMDKPEDSREYRYALAAIEKLPAPPTLPGFLGKPILNSNAPMKDDNSVLIMPNHTVLNHLATSSIKNNVLAVSATTRYKRKVCAIVSLLIHCTDLPISMSQPSCTNLQRRIRASTWQCEMLQSMNWGEGGLVDLDIHKFNTLRRVII